MAFLYPKKISTEGEVGRIITNKILRPLCPLYVLLGEEQTCMPAQYLYFAEEIRDFEVRENDIWVVTYPRTGTTWCQEMVWLIVNNADFKGAEQSLHTRFPFLELSGLFDEKKAFAELNFQFGNYNFNSVETTANQKQNPRFIKTHLPFSLLPDQIKNRTRHPKMIYVIRNAKDVCVSLCHHGNLLQGWDIDTESAAKVFIADKMPYGSYWKHLFGFWKHKDSSNILFIKYEDMKKDLPLVIRQVAEFLEKEISEEQIKMLTKHLSFESMKNNPAVNNEEFIGRLKENNLAPKDGAFLRTGKVGKYREELSPETIKRLDDWIKKNIAGTSFEKEYDYGL